MDVKSFGRNNVEQCAQTLSKKLDREEKVFCIEFNLQPRFYSLGFEIQQRINDGFTIYYRSYPSFEQREYALTLQKINSGANTETLIGMINEDRFIKAKQHLGRVLSQVKAAELPGGEGNVFCDSFLAEQLIVNRIFIWMYESAWSNCADCRFKL